MVNKCKYCGAVSRTSFPFGRNSRARVTFIKKHDKDCPIRKKWERYNNVREQRHN